MPTSTPETPPPLEPEWQRIALLDEIQESLHAYSNQAAVCINEYFESVVVLEGVIEPFSQENNKFFTDQRLELAFFRDNRVSVIIYDKTQRVRRQDYTLKPEPHTLSELQPEDATADSLVRFQLSRTTFSAELAEARLEWYRSTLGGCDLDIAMRVQQLSNLPEQA